ncbi:hypothetical protein NDI43_12670 [Microcoleus vaginatus GB2-A3]|uniref:hypothetical protein n=1 Tax=Microcoleus TaxID=44471 RepID=UPI002FD1ABE9
MRASSPSKPSIVSLPFVPVRLSLPGVPLMLLLGVLMTPGVLVKSATKMSVLLFVSPGTRLEASDENATNRPSAEMEGIKERPIA